MRIWALYSHAFQYFKSKLLIWILMCDIMSLKFCIQVYNKHGTYKACLQTDVIPWNQFVTDLSALEPQDTLEII